MKLLGLFLCIASLVLVVLFFKTSSQINKMRVSAKLNDNERSVFYKKVTVLVLLGIGISVCSAASVLLMIHG